MAETPYLVDSNVLLRWVKPDHRDYPLIVSATDAILRHDGVLCYTSQNVGEFWNTCTRPVDRNGYGLSASRGRPTGKNLRREAPPVTGQPHGPSGVAQSLGNAQRLWGAGSRRAPSGGNARACRLVDAGGTFGKSTATYGDMGGHRITQLAVRFDF
jgi:hypothetical protein